MRIVQTQMPYLGPCSFAKRKAFVRWGILAIERRKTTRVSSQTECLPCLAPASQSARVLQGKVWYYPPVARLAIWSIWSHWPGRDVSCQLGRSLVWTLLDVAGHWNWTQARMRERIDRNRTRRRTGRSAVRFTVQSVLYVLTATFEESAE